MFESFRKSSPANGNQKAGFKSKHILEESYQIIPLLRQIQKSHTLLTLTFGGGNGIYTTAILGVYSDHGFFVLDELTPNSGHKQLLEKKEILVECRYEGVEVRFKARFLEAREKNGIAFYKIALPTAVRYMQRRLDHRVPIHGKTIPFRAYLGGGSPKPIRGELFDISRKGLGAILHESVTLNTGDTLSNCTVTLPGEGNAVFSLEVRYAARNQNTRVIRLGGKFIDIDHESLRKINRTINLLEREEAKRLSRV